MEVKVTERMTAGGHHCYSITGLTFAQLFRIKSAMAEEEKKMKQSADYLEKLNIIDFVEQFKSYAKDAHEVFTAVNDGCV